jgi:ribose transport system substrate-binding protein
MSSENERHIPRRQFLVGSVQFGAALAMSQLSAAYGQGQKEAKVPKQIQLIVHSLNDTYFKQWIAGLNLAAAAHDLKPVINASNADVANHIQILHDAATRGTKLYNGVSPADSAILEIAKICNDNQMWMAHAHAHQPWVMVSALGKYYVHYHAANEIKQSYLVAKKMFEAIGGSGKVINMKGIPGHGASILRDVGFHKAASEFPGIEIVAEDYGKLNRVDTSPVFSGLLTAHPDIRAVTAADDDSAMGCIAILKERRLKDVKVAAIDATQEFLQNVQAGGNAFGTVSILGTWSGVWLATKVWDASQGVELDPLERMMISGSLVITGADAAKAFEEFEYKGARSPIDAVSMSRAANPTSWAPQNALRVFGPDEPDSWWTGRGKAAPRPSNFALPKDWSSSRAANLDKINQMYATRLAAKDPYQGIRSHPGVVSVI